MRASIWQGPYEQVVGEARQPVPRVGEVLVAPAIVGICGSDISAYKGTMGIARPGAIRGHEFAGTIIQSSNASLPLRQRVAIDPVIRCGECPACRSGQDSACHSVEIIGVHHSGALADVVAVPVTQVHPIVDSMSWTAAASAEPLAQAIHDVEIARSGARSLGRCLVIGGGSIGAGIVSVLTAGIGGEMATVDVVDLDIRRHETLMAIGATHVAADVHHASIVTPYDTVFDVVGTSRTRSLAVRSVINGGRIVAVGMGADESDVSWFELIRREITITGANTFGRDDYATALAALSEGRASIPAQRRVIPLESVPVAFAELAAGNGFTGKTFVSVTGPSDDVDEDLADD